MKAWQWTSALAAAAALAAPVSADQTPPGEARSFGSLRALAPETAKGHALDWLQSVGKSDAGTMKEFDAIWRQEDQSLLDRVADSLALGDPAARKLLTEARDLVTPAPTTAPALLTDVKKPAFFRANLALAYARALSNRRVYEESLEVLRTIKPEDVADPAAYFFHRAVAEHGLMLGKEASRSIVGLLEDVADAPERYKMVSLLMYQDMKSWQGQNEVLRRLGDISRKMDNVERRLELARGGPKTQKMQKEVVARLDEIIKKLENQAQSDDNGGC